MIQTFITTMPLQGSGNLGKFLYETIDFELSQNRETSFPIIPILAEHLGQEEKTQIISIRMDNDDAYDNFLAFKKEVENLGISCSCIQEIILPEDQRKVLNKKFLMQIVDMIEDDALVYADVTFGTKPMSAMILYAMDYVEKIKDVEVQGIFYGEIQRVKGKSTGKNYIYDLKEFLRFSKVLTNLDIIGIDDKRQALTKLFEL